MTESVGHWRATYVPGHSLALAGPTSLVVLREPAAAQERLINALWEQVVRSATMSELAARLAVFSIDKLPGFAAFFWTENGMRSMVRGDISITDPTDGTSIADGSGILTWSEVGLGNVMQVSVATGERAPSGPTLPLVVGVAYASSLTLDASAQARVSSPQVWTDGIDSAPAVALAGSSSSELDQRGEQHDEGPDTEPMSALDDTGEQTPIAEEMFDQAAAPAMADSAPLAQPEQGASPAEQLLDSDTRLMASSAGPKPFDPFDPELFAPHQAGAAQAAMPPPVAPDFETPPTLTSATPLVPAMPPSSPSEPSTESMILATDCPQGHNNPPAAVNCRVCGEVIPPQGPRLVSRPVLCVLRADDGTSADVDRAVLVGRAPDPSRSNFKAPRLMTLHSPGHDISRTHIEVAPEGWQVIATDLNSTNGTVLVHPGGHDRQELTPGEHVAVQPGSVLELGDGVSIAVGLPS